jgi:hypothetical protein
MRTRDPVRNFGFQPFQENKECRNTPVFMHHISNKKAAPETGAAFINFV